MTGIDEPGGGRGSPPVVTGQRVLITGGLGFIGAALTRRLVDDGNLVTILDDRPVAGSSAAALHVHRHPGVEIRTGDITDPAAFASLGAGYDVIVHAAAVLGIQRVLAQSVHTLDVNVCGTRLCLEFAGRQRSLRRLVLLSSSEVYGRYAVEATETDSIRLDTDSLRWCYAASKAVAEFMAFAHHAERGTPVTVIRPFNVYGPYRSGENAMTTFIRNAMQGRPLEVSGTGAQRRSWCHVDDFVDGVRRCLATDAAVGEVFNLGNATASLSILALAERVIELTGSASAIRMSGGAEPDVMAREPNLDKARRLLGYRAAIGIDAGIASVAEWLARSGLPDRLPDKEGIR